MDRFDDAQLPIHLATAAARLPGPDYYVVLSWIHRILKPKSYVEIGVRNGESLRAALPETVCIGIDPRPNIVGVLASSTRIFETTSDDLFAKHDLGTLVGEGASAQSFGLAFIDGLHLWEQALRDFANLERHADHRSVILLHDGIPLDDETSQRVRRTHFYSGDVWKLALCLQENRPDLRIVTIRTGPTGLSMITRLDPGARWPGEAYDSLVDRYTRLGYADYVARESQMPRTIGNDFEAVGSWLASTHQDSGTAGA